MSETLSSSNRWLPPTYQNRVVSFCSPLLARVGICVFDVHYQISETCSLADFENQGAHHLAKQYDPDGKRTVGESLLDTTSLLQHNSIHALNRCPH